MRPATRVRRFRLRRGRAHTPKMPSCPLNESEQRMLAGYNAEVARGVLHNDVWQGRMKILQRRWDAWQERCEELRAAS